MPDVSFNENPLDELFHYGVKGMKWGVRKSNKQLRRERAKKNANSQVSKDYKESAFLRRRNPRSLSNAELKKAINRMQLEKQYRELSEHDMTLGEQIFKKYRKASVQQLINTAAQAPFNVAKTMTKKEK